MVKSLLLTLRGIDGGLIKYYMQTDSEARKLVTSEGTSSSSSSSSSFLHLCILRIIHSCTYIYLHNQANPHQHFPSFLHSQFIHSLTHPSSHQNKKTKQVLIGIGNSPTMLKDALLVKIPGDVSPFSHMTNFGKALRLFVSTLCLVRKNSEEMI